MVRIEGLEIETSFTYDFESHGKRYPIEAVTMTEDTLRTSSGILLLTEEKMREKLSLICHGILIFFDENQAIIKKVKVKNQNFLESLPTEGVEAVLVVLAESDLLDEAEVIASSFHEHDIVRFRYKTHYMTLVELKDKIHKEMARDLIELHMNTKEFATVETNQIELSGILSNLKENVTYSAVISYGAGDQPMEQMVLETVTEGEFFQTVTLVPGANYIDFMVCEKETGKEVGKSSHVIFYKNSACKRKECIMWVEQYVSANITDTIEKIERLTDTAKDAGITAFALDLKGVEGYVSYQNAPITHSKYITETNNSKKKHPMEIDFLGEFIRIAHKKGLKVYGSFNFFVEGNIASCDYAINLPETHPDWAEVLYAPEDQGMLKSVLETKRSCMLCYVNPANDEVVEFELLRVREVLEHYKIDAIIMDRTRYDNQYADFSEITKDKFGQFLKQQGKELKQWPTEIYSFDENQKMVFGPLYFDWLIFRSTVIRQFACRLRKLTEEYQVELAAYAGSWYDLYYQNGVNWGSEDFHYNERLKFPLPTLYAKGYQKTSYLEYIDFIMIGCYYETEGLIEKYTTIGNIVTCNQIPVVSSLSLPHLTTQEALEEGVKACLNYSDGMMVFDLCYTNWESLKSALRTHNN